MSGGLYVNRPKTAFYMFDEVEVHKKTKSDSYVETGMRYINGMGHTVYITDRSGVKVEVPPTFSSYGGFTVIKTLNVRKDVNIYVDDIYNVESKESKVMVEAVTDHHCDRIINYREYAVSYFVPKEEIESKGGSLYLYNLDLLISCMNDMHTPYHPFSEVGYRNIMMMDEENANEVNDFGISIKIIDSSGIYGDRFINISGKVFKIQRRDYWNGLPDGVYFVSSPESHGNIVTGKPNSVRYEFSVADKNLGLYKSQEDAEVYGDVEAEREKELKRLTMEVKERDLSLKKEKQELESEFELKKRKMESEWLEREMSFKKEEHEREMEINRLKAELDERSRRRKDYYEERSHDRKDTSEALKYIPAMISLATAIITAVVALNKKG